jgi:hypothetical protein
MKSTCPGLQTRQVCCDTTKARFRVSMGGLPVAENEAIRRYHVTGASAARFRPVLLEVGPRLHANVHHRGARSFNYGGYGSGVAVEQFAIARWRPRRHLWNNQVGIGKCADQLAGLPLLNGEGDCYRSTSCSQSVSLNSMELFIKLSLSLLSYVMFSTALHHCNIDTTLPRAEALRAGASGGWRIRRWFGGAAERSSRIWQRPGDPSNSNRNWSCRPATVDIFRSCVAVRVDARICG